MSGPSRTFSRKPVGLIFFLGILAICANCAWRAKAVTYYAFEYPAPQKETGSPIPDTLMVYRFLLARSVPMESLMISESKDGQESMTAYSWEENPADMITELVLRDFQSSNLFDRTVDQLSPARYRYALEAAVRNLRGFVRDGKAQAVLQVDATLTDFEPLKGGPKTLMKKDYLIELPSADTNPESIMKALNAAVKRLSEQLRRDIRSTVGKTGALDEEDRGLGTSRLAAALSTHQESMPRFSNICAERWDCRR
jgi:ABC-type uncharacterized transport system auxiliary subunit